MRVIRNAALAAVLFFVVPYVAPAPPVVIPPDLLAASDQLAPQPRYRFTSDGCSGGMSFVWWLFAGHGPPWEHCCIVHDFAYWRGGTAQQRAAADAALCDCVAASGHPRWGWLIWAGVRPGGGPVLPTAWRWGYGEPFYTPYTRE